MSASASSVSITERSSAACTRPEVACVMKSNSFFGGCLRLSSVKFESMPPPMRARGKAFRAEAAISCQVARSGGRRIAGLVRLQIEDRRGDHCGGLQLRGLGRARDFGKEQRRIAVIRKNHFQHDLGTRCFSEVAIMGERLCPVLLAQVDAAIEMADAACLHDRGGSSRALRIFRQNAEPQARNAPAGASEPHGHRAGIAGRRLRQLTFEGQRHRLADVLARLDEVGIGERKRP